MVEKPFTISTEEADRVIEAQKNSGKILTVFQSTPLHSFTIAQIVINYRPPLRLRLPHPPSPNQIPRIRPNNRM